jgi:hypothetical protein
MRKLMILPCVLALAGPAFASDTGLRTINEQDAVLASPFEDSVISGTDPAHPFRGGRQDPECPEDTLNNPPIGQPGHSASDPWWSGATSDSDAGAGYVRYESFAGVAEPICDLHWWGFDRWYDGAQWVECDEDPMTFDINFYTDVGGQPGAVACSYTLAVPRTYFGDYGGRDLFEYATTLDPCCTLTDGWVSIQGLDGDPNCWFLWLTSGVGDGTSLIWDGSTLEPYESDLSLCLTPEQEWEHKMHFPQLPDPTGWDVRAYCIEDDWQCSETGYVSDIHFWGSWHADEVGVLTGL